MEIEASVAFETAKQHEVTGIHHIYNVWYNFTQLHVWASARRSHLATSDPFDGQALLQ